MVFGLVMAALAPYLLLLGSTTIAANLVGNGVQAYVDRQPIHMKRILLPDGTAVALIVNRSELELLSSFERMALETGAAQEGADQDMKVYAILSREVYAQLWKGFNLTPIVVEIKKREKSLAAKQQLKRAA
jgi:hypothetical protein